MTLRERLVAAASSESGVIFTLGFIIGFPHYLYADLCSQIADGRMLWSGTFPRILPEAFDAAPWVDHEWLFELLAWPWWAHGLWPAFAALCTVLVALVPLCAVAIARRGDASPFVANAVGYLTIAGAVTSYSVRPQTIAELCFALELYVLLGPLRRPWLLFPLTVVWANAHGSVPLAPLLVALVAVGRSIETRSAPSRGLMIAFACALLGTLVTPSGLALWTSAAPIAARADLSQTADWRPVSLGYPIEFFVLFVYAAVLVAGGVPFVRRNAVALVLLAAFAPMWLLAARFLPFFVIAAVPALAIALSGSGLEQWRRRKPRSVRPGAAWLALPLLAALALTSVLLGPLSVKPQKGLAESDALVRAAGFHGRLFAPFTAGAYLELRGDPVQVLLDTHAVPFAPAAWLDYATIDAGRRGWREALDRRAIAGVIAVDDGALDSALSTAAGWHAVARVPGYVLFVRAPMQAPAHRLR